jgi:hypothetical protein
MTTTMISTASTNPITSTAQPPVCPDQPKTLAGVQLVLVSRPCTNPALKVLAYE